MLSTAYLKITFKPPGGGGLIIFSTLKKGLIREGRLIERGAL